MDYDEGQYEYLKLKKFTKINNNMCTIFTQLNVESWKLCEKRSSIKDYKMFLGMVSETENSSLFINQSESQEIMDLIPMPRFNNLRELSISDNVISNFEALEFIDAPRLTLLNVKQNFVSNLKVFQKLRMDELQVLCISWNMVNSHEELKFLGRFITDKKKEPWVDLEGYAFEKGRESQIFEYDEVRLIEILNRGEENEQGMYMKTCNKMLFSPNENLQKDHKLNKFPFLAKSRADFEKKNKQRLKIIY